MSESRRAGVGLVYLLDQLDLTRRNIESKRRDDEKVLVQSVRDARREGATWGAIAGALGVTRQAAQQRYGGVFR